MLVDTYTCVATQSSARLLIHTEDLEHIGGGYFHAILRSLKALFGRNHDNAHAPLHLQIDDLRGKQMLASNDVGALVDVSLPAGTYQVTAQFGNTRRGYTLTLTQGTTFDLYLRHAPASH